MRIDAHQHFWVYNAAEFGWIDDGMAVMRRDFLPADLKPLLDEAGYDGCIAVQAPQTLDETRILLTLAEENAWLQGVVGWLDLRSPEFDQQLEEFAGNPKLVGLRHIVQAEPPGYLFHHVFRKNVAKLAKLNLTYDLLINRTQLEEAIDFAWCLPNVKIVLDHIAKPAIKHEEWQPWARLMKKLSKQDNIFVKLSGMAFEADWETWTADSIKPYILHTIDCFEPERCMIGSDWPVCLAAGSYARTMGAIEECLHGLSSFEKDRICGGTAAEFYGLLTHK